MKKYLVFLLVLICAGCSGIVTNGNRELTFEQVQQFAQQTMTARVSDGQENPSDGGSSQLMIRPVQKTTPAATASGLTIINVPDEEVGVITRPTEGPVSGPVIMPTAIPTATAAVQIPPVYQVPTASGPYAQQVSTVCERIRFIDDVTIPDNTIMTPGQTFRKVWRIQNAGSCAWSSGYQLIYTDGYPMGTNYGVNLPGPVNPGETVDVGIDLIAPYAYGTYQSNWKLRSPSGNVFGTANSENNAIWVKIVVGTTSNLPTVAPDVTPVNTGCTLLSVKPAYRASFHPGEETDFTLRIRNNTYTVWDSYNYDIAYIGGENMLKRKEQDRRDLPYDIRPGGTYEFSLDAVVPQNPGVYTMTVGVVNGYEIICTMDVTLQVVY